MVKNYLLMYDGDCIYLGDEKRVNNPKIEQREKVVPKIKRLYDEFKAYMTEENMKGGEQLSDEEYLSWGLGCLKTLWEEEARYFYEDMMKDEQLQQEQTKQPYKQGNSIDLPDKLNTDRANIYFRRAIETGYIVTNGTGFKSKFKSKAILAYFLELVFCRDDNGTDNKKDFPETELNNLFNESRLGKARGQYIGNKAGKPKGHEIIDSIFA